MDAIAKHLTLRGRVQGVCFRAWTVEVAGNLGLSGWVRNRANGDVEVVVQGDRKAVERFVALAREGPPAARVDEVEVLDQAVSDLAGFRQRPTI